MNKMSILQYISFVYDGFMPKYVADISMPFHDYAWSNSCKCLQVKLALITLVVSNGNAGRVIQSCICVCGSCFTLCLFLAHAPSIIFYAS
jgi:hypothetical protein